jgi:hypothetical protein
LNSNVNCKDSTTLCASLIQKNFWFYIITQWISKYYISNKFKRSWYKLFG